jgi:hypothetical protein
METAALNRLRQFAARPPAAEHCELCSANIGESHEHLLDIANGQLICACGACAILFERSATRKRVPRRVRWLTEFAISNGQWESLRLPINMAFFVDSTPHGRTMAYYPSPAGATESMLELDAWEDIRRDNPVVATMASDVEALLVNRVAPAPEYFLAPIDQCYRLVGLIRSRWKGLSGGPDVWRATAEFFDDLRRRA